MAASVGEAADRNTHANTCMKPAGSASKRPPVPLHVLPLSAARQPSPLLGLLCRPLPPLPLQLFCLPGL